MATERAVSGPIRTNVRVSERALRWSAGALSALAPPLAVRLADRLFTTPPRRSSTMREVTALVAARRSTVSTPHGDLAVWTWSGPGPRVLVVHGWGGRAGQFGDVVRALRAAGFDVVAFDAPAHGLSPGTRSSLIHLRDAVHAVAVARGPVYAVIGHSLGALAAGMALAEGVEAERAVLFAAPSDPSPYPGRFARYVGFSADVAAALVARIPRRLGVPWPRTRFAELGPRITARTLVVHDQDDPEIPWTDGAAIARCIPGAALLTTTGLGHHRVLRAAPVIEKVVEFLAAPAASKETIACAHRAPGATPCALCALERELFDPSWRRHAGDTNTTP